MYVYDVFHLLLSLFNFQFSFRIGICEWSVWDHASPFSLSPFLPLPHPVSWRIKLMIVPVLNYSWFNKIDAYLFRFVASQNFLSLLNHHFIIFHLKVVGLTPLVLLAFCQYSWKGGSSPHPSVQPGLECFQGHLPPLWTTFTFHTVLQFPLHPFDRGIMVIQ